MQQKFTFKKPAVLLRQIGLFLCFLVAAASINAQTVVSTASGVNYLGNYSINNPAPLIQSFAVQNTNAFDVVLTQVDMQMAPYFGASGASDIKLYYSATSLSGVFTATGPAWTLIGTGSTTVPAVLTVIPVITGINFVIPANTQYRFAIEASKGMAFSFSPTPTPNNFTNGGVVLQCGDFQIAGGNVGYAGISPTPPGTNTPSFFGGSITFSSSSACAGTPTPGATTSTAAAVCPTVNFTLSTSTPPPPGTTGLTYQWQSSATLAGPYTDIPGATNATLTTTQTAGTYYQVVVTCTTGGTATSTPVFVDLTPSSGCYCAAGSTDVNPLFEKIGNVEFGTINNPSTSPVGYENFTGLPTVATFEAGSTNTITVTGSNTYPGDQVLVWIDYNQNGSFSDPGELVFTSTIDAGPYVGNIVIPVSATLGNTRMRIRMLDAQFGNGNNTPCGDNTYGQVEDYTINITACIPGTISVQPTDVTSYCSGNASLSVTATGTGLTYQWQVRPDGASPWTIVNNGGIYSGAGTNTLTLTNLLSSYDGYQFQVAIGGPCTPIFLSDTITLTVGPLVANVTPTEATICNGTIQPLTITTTAPPATQTFTSGPINVDIPDGNPTPSPPFPASVSTIAVAGIPAGAVITGMSVKLNISHQYVGDLVIVLQAPNGNIFNLDALLSKTNNPGIDFVNTVISSDGTTPLSDGTEPFTGVFAPDAAGPTFTIGTFTLPGGPDGYIPNSTSFSDLYSTPNGTWTIAMYDAGAPDGGTLTSWDLNISYGAAFNGVWFPAATLFTDPAATIPYVAGTLANTVYALPTVTTTYGVTISTVNCTSDTTLIPITVANPVGAISAPANASACTNGTATFTADAAPGNPLEYQWQVSIDGGTTWNDLTDGVVYSGSNTGTLSLTNIPATYNDHQFRLIISVTACTSTDTSAVATLTVNPTPVVTISAGPNSTLYPGLTTILTATSTPAAATYQWYRNGILVPGATSNTININVDNLGDYTVTVTDVNGCTGTSGVTTISSAPNDVVFIYPSPTTGVFQVRYYAAPGNPVVRTLSVFDSKGARVLSRKYSNTDPYSSMDVDMTQHAKGIYRVELGDRNGKRLKTGTVIIL